MRLGTAVALVLWALAWRAWAQTPDHPASFVFRLPAPPAGFRPALASDAELATYGLPARPRPDAHGSVRYATWAHAMNAAQRYVAPRLVLDRRMHGPALLQSRTEATAYTSLNWAGQAIVNAAAIYGPSSYTKVLAQWVVSAVQQPVGSCSGTDYSATWVGIDGFIGSPDVSQAGTEADATCAGGVTAQDNYAWFEWYPADGYEITNFPIARGGSIFVVLQATSAGNANATYVNLQTGDYTVASFAAPSGTQLRGNTVEWIVERPSPGPGTTPGTLADFGDIALQSEVSFLVSQLNTSNFIEPGLPAAAQTGYTLTMATSTGVRLTAVTPQGASDQLIQVEGPAE